jgi:hypothetical protein
MAPLSPGFDSETRLHEALVAEFIADLPDFGIDALGRRSLLPRAKIIALAEAHEAEQWAAMTKDGFAPSCLAIDTVFLSKKIGDKRKAVHVTAADPLTRPHRVPGERPGTCHRTPGRGARIPTVP